MAERDAGWELAAAARLREGSAIADGRQLHARAAAWTEALRAAGVREGDRVALAMPPGVPFVAALFGAAACGCTVALAPAGAEPGALAAEVDARLVLGAGARPSAVPAPRSVRHPLARDVRLLVRTGGSTGAGRWIALSAANVAAVLDSHAAPLAYAGATVVSVLPWHHVFGLVIELLSALRAGATIVRDPSGGRDPAALRTLLREPLGAGARVRLNAVPLTLRRLAADDAGRALLGRLDGGVVGGAPVDAALAAVLAGTRLRVGYGQTEAAPGICLGDAGAWRAATLGRPLGCAVRVDDDGVLAFRGANACVGTWDAAAGLARLAPDRWVRTGDLAHAEPDGTYSFEGRASDAFKLANGRQVGAGALERLVLARFPALREAVLSSPDGEALLLACTPPPDAPDAVPPPALVAPLLGALAGRPLQVIAVPEGRWARTPKGEVDRRWPAGLPSAP